MHQEEWVGRVNIVELLLSLQGRYIGIDYSSTEDDGCHPVSSNNII